MSPSESNQKWLPDKLKAGGSCDDVTATTTSKATLTTTATRATVATTAVDYRGNRTQRGRIRLADDSTRRSDALYCCRETSFDLLQNYSVFCHLNVPQEEYFSCEGIFHSMGFDRGESQTARNRVTELAVKGFASRELKLDQIMTDFPFLDRLEIHRSVMDNVISRTANEPVVKILKIIDSGLTSLVGNAFRCCRNTLQHLDLSRNELKIINNYTFIDLFQLISINLSSNKLQTLELNSFYSTQTNETSRDTSDCFQGSCSNSLTTEGNTMADHIKTFDESPAIQSILINNTNHVVVLTDRAEIKEYKGASSVKSWTKLETFDLSRNQISGLDPFFFCNVLRHIKHLHLSFNRLSSLSRVLLRDLEFLETLDISHNSLAWIDGGFFVHRYLKSIDLSNNNIKKILSMTFLYLPAIRNIDLSRNEISYIHRTAFYRLCKKAPSSDISRISISLHSNNLQATNAWRITNIIVDSLLGNISENCRVNLDLGWNKISHLFGGGMEAIKPYDIHYLKRFWLRRLLLNMSGNGLVCDCSSLSDASLLIDLLSEKYWASEAAYEMRYGPSKGSLEALLLLECSEPGRFSGLTLAQFHESERLQCDISDSLKSSVNNLYCPEGCSCEKRDNLVRLASYSIPSVVFFVNCSKRQLVNFPYPAQFSLIYSDSSVVKEKQLLLFDTDHRSLDYDEDHESSSAVEIDLSYNFLTKIDFKRLAKLYPNLNSLNLHENNFPLISESVFQLKSLKNLTLAGNPLRCTCVPATILPLKELAINGMITDLSAILCIDGPPLEDFLKHDLKFCLSHFKTLRLVGEGHSYVENASEISFPAAVICSLVIAFLLTIVVYLKVKKYRKKQKSTDWSLRCLPTERSKESTEEKLFCETGEPRLTKDVFVMYCDEEESWVTGCLLEIFWSRFPRYRVCLQQHIQDDNNFNSRSDRTASSAMINTPASVTGDESSEFSKLIPSSAMPGTKTSLGTLQINDCLLKIRQSQLTVVILSENFLKTFWTNDHFRSGLLRYMESQRYRFIVIFRQRWLNLEERDRALYAAVCDYDCLMADDERLGQKLGELLPQPLPCPTNWGAGVHLGSPPEDGIGVEAVTISSARGLKCGRTIQDKSGRYVKILSLINEKY